MRFRLRLPGLSQPASDVVSHVALVFAVAFLAQLGAGALNVRSIPTLLALLTSSAAAGVAAVTHILLGLMPTPPPIELGGGYTAHRLNAVGISLKVKTKLTQVLTSVLATFLSIFGAELVGAALPGQSLPDLLALALAAVAAAVAGVVSYLVGLIPAPAAK